MEHEDLEQLPADARRWTFPERHPTGEGPWAGEPDKVQWVDAATDLDCLAVRSPFGGNWCGYVGVPPGHPWHGVDADRIDAYAYNGVTYADRCQPAEDLEGRGICHVAAPGRPEDVWWVGFHCGGLEDYSPILQQRLLSWETWIDLGHSDETYRTLSFVVGVTHILAAQAALAGAHPGAQLTVEPSATS